MSLILDDLYTEIADAIREKENSTPVIAASEFSDHIRGIETPFNASSYPLVIHSVKGATIKAVQDDVEIVEIMGGGVPNHLVA